MHSFINTSLSYITLPNIIWNSINLISICSTHYIISSFNDQHYQPLLIVNSIPISYIFSANISDSHLNPMPLWPVTQLATVLWFYFIVIIMIVSPKYSLYPTNHLLDCPQSSQLASSQRWARGGGLMGYRFQPDSLTLGSQHHKPPPSPSLHSCLTAVYLLLKLHIVKSNEIVFALRQSLPLFGQVIYYIIWGWYILITNNILPLPA